MKLHNRKVKQLLKERGITARDMAKDLDFSYDVLKKYLCGQYNMPQRRVQEVADYFGVPLLEVVQFRGFDY